MPQMSRHEINLQRMLRATEANTALDAQAAGVGSASFGVIVEALVKRLAEVKAMSSLASDVLADLSRRVTELRTLHSKAAAAAAIGAQQSGAGAARGDGKEGAPGVRLKVRGVPPAQCVIITRANPLRFLLHDPPSLPARPFALSSHSALGDCAAASRGRW